MQFENPYLNDNRNYQYLNKSNSERKEFDIISSLVFSNAKVIDLGCGDGTLLANLIKEKNISATGIEISESGIEACLEKGINVIKKRIDEVLPFKNDEFDFSICNVTLQMVMYPEILLMEMKRISKYQIISFPNFAFYKNRLQLLLSGKMPTKMLFGYEWYNTGHIHQLSIKDFKKFISTIDDWKILNEVFIKERSTIKNIFMLLSPNLFQQITIFLLGGKS